jgi:hypothetical protein
VRCEGDQNLDRRFRNISAKVGIGGQEGARIKSNDSKQEYKVYD